MQLSPGDRIRSIRATPRRAWNFLHSIRFRLTAWFVIILALVLLAFNAFVYRRQMNDLRSASLDQLAVKTRTLAQVYRFSGLLMNPDWEQSLTGLNTNLEQLLQSDETLVLFLPQGQVIQKLGPLTNADVAALQNNSLSPDQNGRNTLLPFETHISGNRDYYFVAAPLPMPRDNLAFLIVGAPALPADQVRGFLLTLLLADVATLSLALIGGYWLASRAMRPVHVITQTAQEIGETDLSRRLNLHSQDELGELADTFDQMLARLQAAFDRQRQFTADASHELRTPLTIVNLEAERALSSRRSPDEYVRVLNVIHSENDFMSCLVNDLLTLARMDAGQTIMKTEIVDLSDVALEIVERLSPLASRKGVVLSTGELPELEFQGDRQYLVQMLSNLVENAIKYSGESGKRVRVETGRSTVEGKDYAWVRVEDNGQGIAAEHLPHLFERFYRVDKARTHDLDRPGEHMNEDPGGTGLGLSIVQWIVQAHHGKVNVSSEPGKGTTFEVLFPI
ncbi:MAG: ATP-binding protein [Omnitrophica WOR_2 bacterium]